MRIVYAAPDKAKAMAEAAVAHEHGVMNSNADNAAFSAFGSEGNPMVFVIVGYTDYKVAADITSYMNGYNDPRRDAYFTVSSWSVPYAGVRRGFPAVSPGRNDARTQKYSTIKLTGSDPVQWMNAAEVAFLRAEAVAVFGFDMGGTAEEFYNEGINLSFEQWGIGGAAAYLGNDTSVATPYIDPCTDFGNDYNRQFSTITIAWKNDASKEEMQERIITQKWIANYTLGNEAWADYRRTGYPRLIPVIANLSSGVVSSELGARRIPYPRSEYVNNTANINTAVAEHLKGSDNMATKLWWDCKNN
jgi:hypothetical protein